MARILVLGYGNPMRSDDGLGWQIAVDLFRTNGCPDVEVLPCHQLTPELAPAVSRVDVVIFVDCEQGGNPGEIRCREVRSESIPLSFTHHLTPGALLALSSELFGACPRAWLLSIQGQEYSPGESFSPTVAAHISDLKARLQGLIQESLDSTPVAY
jgi:hydrogenase maturation protease